MMNLTTAIQHALETNASDLHFSQGQNLWWRIDGELRPSNDQVDLSSFISELEQLAGPQRWKKLQENMSCDFSAEICGVRCRFNIFIDSNGLSAAIRILSSFDLSLEQCHLHPELRNLLNLQNGLVIVTGSTGSGKSTTLASFVQEINRSKSQHIITIESPIEYQLPSQKSLIHQREVGGHTPDVESGLIDSLREDPDILVVGEMRTPESMRLTLNAAETGHLVIATMHSSTVADALSRIVSSFDPVIQHGVAAQLADTLKAVIAQKLVYYPEVNMRIPVCEIMVVNTPVRTHIRKREFAKLISVMQTHASEGMWTEDRYRQWIESTVLKSVDVLSSSKSESFSRPTIDHQATEMQKAPPSNDPSFSFDGRSSTSSEKISVDDNRIEIGEHDLEDFDEIISKFDK